MLVLWMFRDYLVAFCVVACVCYGCNWFGLCAGVCVCCLIDICLFVWYA